MWNRKRCFSLFVSQNENDMNSLRLQNCYVHQILWWIDFSKFWSSCSMGCSDFFKISKPSILFKSIGYRSLKPLSWKLLWSHSSVDFVIDFSFTLWVIVRSLWESFFVHLKKNYVFVSWIHRLTPNELFNYNLGTKIKSLSRFGANEDVDTLGFSSPRNYP